MQADGRLRFADVAVALGYVAASQVHEALSIQHGEVEGGLVHRRIGDILRELGWITDRQCHHVLDTLFELARHRQAFG